MENSSSLRHDIEPVNDFESSPPLRLLDHVAIAVPDTAAALALFLDRNATQNIQIEVSGA